MDSSEFSKMLTLNQVAEMLAVHPNTVRRWAAQGLLPSYDLGPRHIRRFQQREVEAFVARHRRGQNGNSHGHR